MKAFVGTRHNNPVSWIWANSSNQENSSGKHDSYTSTADDPSIKHIYEYSFNTSSSKIYFDGEGLPEFDRENLINPIGVLKVLKWRHIYLGTVALNIGMAIYMKLLL